MLWFIEKLKAVNTADEEIIALFDLKTKTEAIINTIELKEQNKKFVVDSLATIKVIEYQTNYIKYEANNTNDGYAVFSEMYYINGWNAYINNEKIAYNRVDYLLRGMEIPKGKHNIEFKFEPQIVKTGSTITLTSSILLMLIVFGGLFFHFRKKK